MTMRNSSGVGRRQALATAGTLLGSGLAGCFGLGSESVRVLAAGSLARTIEDHVGPAFEAETDVTVHGEYFGANAVMRMVEERTTHPDVIVSADATLLRDRLYGEVTDWDVEFATNSVGIAYSPETAVGATLDDGDPWTEVVLAADDGDVAISDPDLDPLGYRSVQAFDLAAAEYGLDGFRDKLLERVYVEPEEPQLLAGVESGSRAAAIAYRNMAIDHDLSFLEFPDAYNFANPEYADHYATVEFTTDEEGYTAEGRPVIYNATVHNDADSPDPGRRFVQFLVETPELLSAAGLTVSGSVPRTEGAVPEAIDI